MNHLAKARNRAAAEPRTRVACRRRPSLIGSSSRHATMFPSPAAGSAEGECRRLRLVSASWKGQWLVQHQHGNCCSQSHRRKRTYGSRRMRAASDTTRLFFSSGAVTPKLFDIRLILVPCRLQLQARRPSTCLSGYAPDGRIEKSQVRAIVWALKICGEIYCGVYQKVQNRAGPAAGAPRHGEARCPCVQIAMHCRACTPARLLWATGQVRK